MLGEYTINNFYNCDVLEGLRKLPSCCIDLIVTSPPYNNWRNKRTQKRKEEYWKRTKIEYDGYDDKRTDEEYAKWQIEVINECLRVLKPTGTLCYNHKDQIFDFKVISPLSWILQSDAVFRQRIVWDRGGMQAFNNVRFYRCEEDIYILGKQTAVSKQGDKLSKGFKWNKEFAKYMSIWKITPSRKKNHGGHPAPFPIEMPKRCIECFTNEGDIVLDPFMGSGTTGVAAHQLKRNYIGFEQSKAYHDNSVLWITKQEELAKKELLMKEVQQLLKTNSKITVKEARIACDEKGLKLTYRAFYFIKGYVKGCKQQKKTGRKEKV